MYTQERRRRVYLKYEQRRLPSSESQELKAARRDPQYEKNHDIQSYVICRVCGLNLKLLTVHHLWRHGTTIDEYRHEFPGAQICSLRFHQNERRTLYGDWSKMDSKEYSLARYLKYEQRQLPRSRSQELVAARRDPQYEKNNHIQSYVICRVCGLDLTIVSQSHLARHGKTKDEYLHEFPGAQVSSRHFRQRQRLVCFGANNVRGVILEMSDLAVAFLLALLPAVCGGNHALAAAWKELQEEAHIRTADAKRLNESAKKRPLERPLFRPRDTRPAPTRCTKRTRRTVFYMPT